MFGPEDSALLIIFTVVRVQSKEFKRKQLASLKIKKCNNGLRCCPNCSR